MVERKIEQDFKLDQEVFFVEIVVYTGRIKAGNVVAYRAVFEEGHGFGPNWRQCYDVQFHGEGVTKDVGVGYLFPSFAEATKYIEGKI